MWFTRYIVFALTIILTLIFVALGTRNPHFYWGVLVFGPLAILGPRDIV
jgi:hypothetical protein